MPLYEYECTTCGHRTELLQRHDSAPLEACPECGGAVRRLLSAPAFQFKGTGWYATDYAGKGKDPSAKTDEGGESPKSGETKTESKTPKESSGNKKTSSGSPSD